jgi:AraC-like DNA-binding protein
MKIQSAYIVALRHTLRDLGHDPSVLKSNGAELEEEEFYELCAEAAALAQDPALALKFGSSLHLGSHGLLGNGLMSCRTLRQAAEFLIRHNPLKGAQSKVRFAFDGENVTLSMTPGIDIPGAGNFRVESFFAAVVTAIGELLGTELVDCRIEFTFQPAMPEDVYRSYLRMPVFFGMPANRLVGRRFAVDLPLVAANNAVADMFVRQCDALLRERDRPASHALQVRRELAGARQALNEHDVAGKLNMSGRTLRRRLQSEGTTFQEIVDEVRNDRACACLCETQLSIAEVGALLGFDDVANFRRAFRRWNGCSPQDYRAAASGGGEVRPVASKEAAFEVTST